MNKTKNLTIDDIALELGVSKTTVSRAISGKGRISKATRARMLADIKKANYRPSAAAKGLAESKTYNLAFVLPRSLFKLDTPFVRRSMTAICEEAFLQGYYILLCLSTDDNPATLLRTLDNRKVDGVILARTVENDPLVDILSQRDIPFATMGSLAADAKGKATVEADHDQVGGCCAFTTAFLRGYKGKLGILGNDPNYIVNQSRLRGVQMALASTNLPEDSVFIRHNINSATACAEAVEEMLAQGVTRFIAMDDEICADVVPYLQQKGLDVPNDVQVGALFDTARLAAFTPAVPALKFDTADLGRVACRELLHHLRGEDFVRNPTLGYRILMR